MSDGVLHVTRTDLQNGEVLDRFSIRGALGGTGGAVAKELFHIHA